MGLCAHGSLCVGNSKSEALNSDKALKGRKTSGEEGAHDNCQMSSLIVVIYYLRICKSFLGTCIGGVEANCCDTIVQS